MDPLRWKTILSIQQHLSAYRRKRWALWLGAAYLALWLLTATVGRHAADTIFAREFSQGATGFGSTAKPTQVTRLPFQRLRDPRDFKPQFPAHPWRMRSRGIAVAPFLIVDEAAWQTHALSGFAGWRLVVWFFGYSAWLPLKTYWVS